MDFLYVAKRVPYLLTAEVYGRGGCGKLQPVVLQVSELFSLLQCDCYFVLVQYICCCYTVIVLYRLISAAAAAAAAARQVMQTSR
jgi:hypothetical protein